MRTFLLILSLIAAFIFAATPAAAVDGQILITQAKANAGGVSPGDTAGYPITISQPGSYKLASNLTVNKATRGIIVTAHDVTIDFNGFRLFGNNIGNIGILSAANSLTIKNGMISLFKSNAIHGSGPFWTIDNMRIVFNAGNGIYATGSARQWVVSNSMIVENGSLGIQMFAADPGILIRNNLVNGNGLQGIEVRHAHIEGSMISGNGGSLSSGILIHKGMVLGSTITDNGGYGISAASASVGFGNNTLSGNNVRGSGGQVADASDVHPNLCNGAAC
jgi:hypothetical protein